MGRVSSAGGSAMWENAAVVAVGDEVLTGEVINTNGAWLSRRLLAAGARVRRQVVVGDDVHAIAETVRRLLTEVDLVVVVGGLGPTPDDLTRDGVSAALNLPLQPDAAIAALIAPRHRAAAGREESVRRQSLILTGAEVLPNSAGTAPGQLVYQGQRAVVMLPGPPHECQAVADVFLPRVERATGRRVLRLTWRCYDLSESEMAHYLGDLLTAPVPRAGLYVSPGVVELRLEMPAAGPAMPPELSAAGALARARVPAPLYDQSLPVSADDLVATLAERRETVALAESLTGGLLATQLTAVPGASQVVLEGQVVYTNEAKARLGLPPDFLCEKGAVSAEVARLLARRIRERAGSTWGVGLTGFAGPGGGTVDNPVGTYYCAVAGPEGVLVRRRRSGAARDVVRRAAAETARFLLAGAISAQPGFEWES